MEAVRAPVLESGSARQAILGQAADDGRGRADDVLQRVQHLTGRLASRSYLPEVDSLRAFAAVAVVAYHMDLLPVGWAGVWLFFVLSGFVITWMLLGADWQLSLGSYLGFARRRAARIWPLYFLYAALGLAGELAWGSGHAVVARALTLLTFTYDFQAAAETEFTLFHHLWTISVEQQFYLLYPLVFAAARRWRSTGPVLALVAVSLGLRVAEFLYARAAGLDSRILFYWSFGQFDAFAIGALIAFHAEAFRRPAVYRAAIVLAGSVAIAVVAFDVAANNTGRGVAYALAQPFIFPTRLPFHAAMPVTTYLAVVAIAAAALATAIGPESAVRRVLRWAPLVGTGRISYGLYIWHMVVVTAVFASFGAPVPTAPVVLRLALFVPCLGLSIGAAHLSYRYYESRFHRRIGTAPTPTPPLVAPA